MRFSNGSNYFLIVTFVACAVALRAQRDSCISVQEVANRSVFKILKLLALNQSNVHARFRRCKIGSHLALLLIRYDMRGVDMLASGSEASRHNMALEPLSSSVCWTFYQALAPGSLSRRVTGTMQ